MAHKLHARYKRSLSWTLVIFSSLLMACGGGGGGGGNNNTGPVGTTPQTLNVTISWSPNKELRVNQAGGGYKVYISQTSGFDINDADVTVIDVPWVSGSQAPVSYVKALSSGTYFVRIAAYTAFPVANTSSKASAEVAVSVPFTTP